MKIHEADIAYTDHYYEWRYQLIRLAEYVKEQTIRQTDGQEFFKAYINYIVRRINYHQSQAIAFASIGP